MQQKAADTVLDQAKLLCKDWAETNCKLSSSKESSENHEQPLKFNLGKFSEKHIGTSQI